MTRYIVIGAGAIGGSIGAALSDSGIPVGLVARGEHAAAIESRGLTLSTPHATITARPTLLRRPEEISLRNDDVLILATKTHQAPTALAQWVDRPVHDEAGHVLGPAGSLLPMLLVLNGVEAEHMAVRYFARVHSVAVWMPAVFLEPGEVAVRMGPRLGAFFAGPVTPAAEDGTLARVGADLESAGFLFRPVEDVMAHKYGKLLANLGNGLDVVLGSSVDVGPVRSRLRAEAKAVYATAGISYVANGPTEFGLRDLMQVGSVPGVDAALSSSWQSLARGTGGLETDYLSGEIVALGHRHGADVRRNGLIAALCREVLRTSSAEAPLPLLDGRVLPDATEERLAAITAAFDRFDATPQATAG